MSIDDALIYVKAWHFFASTDGAPSVLIYLRLSSDALLYI